MIATLDVLWSGLEIIDEDYLNNKKEEEIKFEEELKTATDIVEYIGPRGGQKYITFSYTNYEGENIINESNYHSGRSIDEIKSIFKKHGKTIKVDVIY